MLRDALLDPSFTADGWRNLLATTAMRPSAVEVLVHDLEELQSHRAAAVAADKSMEHKDMEGWQILKD